MIFIIASHVGFVKGNETFGLASHITRYLHSHNLPYVYLKHCLTGETASQIEFSPQNIVRGQSKYHHTPVLIRSLEHIGINIKQALAYRDDEVYFIGVDPVNSLAGFLLKKVGKIKHNVFLCADYADSRYQNPLLNFIYHFVDRLALSGADEVWCVSSRILSKRIEQGISKKKLLLFPNSPNFNEITRVPYNGNKRLVVVTHFNTSFNLSKIIAIMELVKKSGLIVELDIIGFGPEEKRFKQMARESTVGKNIHFIGQLSHLAAMKKISESFLGIALYTNENSWNWYGDSMKARDYAAAGIPFIINNIPSTSDDVRKLSAGLVINDTTALPEIARFIKKCATNTRFYLSLRKNACAMGKDFDKESILNKIFHSYL